MAGSVKYIFGAGTIKNKLGPVARAKAGNQGQGWGQGNTNTQLTCLQRKLKETVYKSKQIPGGKLSQLARMKFNFPM